MRSVSVLLAAVVIAALAALAAPPALALVPGTISYQGVLTDPGGVPVADGAYNIRFRLYRPDGTTLLWEETQSVALAGGRFSVALGSVTTFGALAFDEAYRLGVKVGADPEMTPLPSLASAPFSLTARSVVMAPTPRYYSISPEDFTPGSNTVTYARNTVRLYSGVAGAASFATGLHLPHGARLTELRVLFDDLDATREMAVSVRRTSLNIGIFEQITAVASGVANAAGVTAATNTPVSTHIVDNQNWSYSVQAFWGSANGVNQALLGVRITYEITTPLP